MSDAFIREVDEDLRQKQLKNFWKTYGKFIIGIAVGIVLLVGGRSFYNYIMEAKYEKQATAYANALKSDESLIPTALDPIIASDVDGYKIIATFKKAELAIKAGDNQGAIKIFDQFIATANVPQFYKDTANIQAALLAIEVETTDQIRTRLSLILNGDSGFKYLGEELVGLSELKSGEIAAAKTRLKGLTEDLEVPASVKERAEQYLSVIE